MEFLKINNSSSRILGRDFNNKMSSLEYLLKRIMLIYKTEKVKNILLIDRAIELIESVNFPSWPEYKFTPTQNKILKNFISTHKLLLNQSKQYLLLLKRDDSIEEKDNFRLMVAAQRSILNCRGLVVDF